MNAMKDTVQIDRVIAGISSTLSNVLIHASPKYQPISLAAVARFVLRLCHHAQRDTEIFVRS